MGEGAAFWFQVSDEAHLAVAQEWPPINNSIVGCRRRPHSAHHTCAATHWQAGAAAHVSADAMTRRPAAAHFSARVLMYTIGPAATAGMSAARMQCHF